MKIIIITGSLFIVLSVCLLQTELQFFYPFTTYAIATGQNYLGLDKFGIREIYSTKENGREWYVDMENPKEDENFSITFNPNITRQDDGSWRISAPVVRMNVKTLEGETNW